MGFRLPKTARKFFENIWERPTEDASLKLYFDMYYLCLMAGFKSLQIAEDRKEFEDADFVEDYPQAYVYRAPLFAGLLIKAEMDRKKVATDDRQTLQTLMLMILDSRSNTLLSKLGQTYLDQYAAGGMGEIEDSIPKPTDLGAFLIDYRNFMTSGNTIA